MHSSDDVESPRVCRARADEMEPVTLYRVLWLRSAVFNGEQQCTEPDLDGRELESGTTLLWVCDGHHADQPVATLRILDDGDHVTLGRVVTAAGHRGRGIGEVLVRHALDLVRRGEYGDVRVVSLHAQAHLEKWYEGLGFTVCGPHFEEAGIDHVPMTLTV